ncbi:MAG: tryptophan synthase subunit alpha [Thermodesulfobacteriota bacterium]
MRLADRLRQARSEKDILLMTHLVLGYPSFEANREVIRQMVASGVDVIELQIPFSEPMADGPVIIRANQEAIAHGVRVRECLAFAAEMAATHPIPFLFMTYYNILFKYGVEDFIKKSKEIGITGFIVPDLPPEEGGEYLALCQKHALSPIQIFAPTSTDARMRELAGHAEGFIYCVARRGVTGSKTEFGPEFYDYLARCRAATDLPLAVGFGIASRQDVEVLTGKADIAVIGTATIRLVEEQGLDAVGPFIAGLRPR